MLLDVWAIEGERKRWRRTTELGDFRPVVRLWPGRQVLSDPAVCHIIAAAALLALSGQSANAESRFSAAQSSGLPEHSGLVFSRTTG
jgi:hypothetical protein